METVRTSIYVRSRSARPAPLHGVRSRRTCRACGQSLWRMDSGPYRWLWCPHCDQAVRIGHVRDESGQMSRVCKNCGEVIE